MFAYFYQACLIIFLLQGFSTPFLTLIAGVVWWKRSRRLESLERELRLARRKTVKSDVVFESALDKLPKLRPLNCASCGGSLLLRKAETLCPYCGTRGDLPEDYAEALTLKSEVR